MINQETARRMAELLGFLDERKHEDVVYLSALYHESPSGDDDDQWTVRDEISELVDLTISALP